VDAKRAKNAVASGAMLLSLDASAAGAAIEMGPAALDATGAPGELHSVLWIEINQPLSINVVPLVFEDKKELSLQRHIEDPIRNPETPSSSMQLLRYRSKRIYMLKLEICVETFSSPP
jgi:hypothetical protein